MSNNKNELVHELYIITDINNVHSILTELTIEPVFKQLRYIYVSLVVEKYSFPLMCKDIQNANYIHHYLIHENKVVDILRTCGKYASVVRLSKGMLSDKISDKTIIYFYDDLNNWVKITLFKLT